MNSMRAAVLLCWLSLSAWAAETMRIAVGPEATSVTVEGESLRVGADADDARYEPFSANRVTVKWVRGALSVDGQPVPGEALRFRSMDDGRGRLSVNSVRVRGDVVVTRGKSALVAVNVLPLEDYLVGVIGSEMPKSFPPEALKAQAVAARTYALHKKLEQLGQPYYLGSSVISQVYRGLDAEDARTHEAVESTRGIVMTWQLQPIEAYFHSSCGGRTESGLDALGRALPYLQPVDCPCGRLPSSHWTLQVKPTELAALSGAKKSTLRVQGRSPTGRVRRVDVGPRSFDAVTFRERLGYMRLKSLHFEVSKARDGWTLDGQGFGHGAGLCQWGARLYAEKGWDWTRILSHYYPGVEFQTLYE